jgi:hypothetical protein
MQQYSQVLEGLSEPETFHVIDFVRIHSGNVVDTSIPNICRQILLEAHRGTNCIVVVFGIAGHAPSIEVRLKDFRTKIVVGRSNIEAMLVIEIELLLTRWSAASVIAVARRVCKNFRANPSTRNKESAQ